MRIFFRYDDFSNRSPAKLESQLIDLFSKHDISCLFGIVPFVCAGNEMSPRAQGEEALSFEKISLLKLGLKKRAIECALHGCNHQTIHPEGQRPSEFRGAAFEQQIQRISRGKRALEVSIGQLVRYFVPPWNDYDKNTLKVLSKLNFDAISTGKRLGVVDPDSSIKYLPISTEIDELDKAIKNKLVKNKESIVGILFHPYEFYESGDKRAHLGLDRLDKLLIWIKNQADFTMRSFSELLALSIDLSAHRYLANWNLRKLRGKLPKYMKLLIPQGEYFSHAKARSVAIRARLIWYGLLLICILFLSLLLFGAMYFL